MRSCSTKLEKGRNLTLVRHKKPKCASLVAALILIGCTTAPQTQEAKQATASGIQPVQGSLAHGRVWLDARSGVYHCPGTRWYGNTNNSYFLDEAKAKSAGYRPAYGKPCSGQVRTTAYLDTKGVENADPLLLGNWMGEVYEIKGFPSKMGLQIDSKEYHGYIGHASVIGAKRNPTGLPNCQDADITLETYTDGYYHITFDGEGCDGRGKLRHRENRLSGQARINAVQIFIKLVKAG